MLSGSGHWLSQWWAGAGSPGWDWSTTPSCTGCGGDPRSEAPVWRTLPPRRSRIPYQTWPGRGGEGDPESALGAPQPQTQHSPHCPCSPLWSPGGLLRAGAKMCWCLCQASGVCMVGASQTETGLLIEGSWLRERGGKEGQERKKKKGMKRFSYKPNKGSVW